MKMKSKVRFLACLPMMTFLMGIAHWADARPAARSASIHSAPAKTPLRNWLGFSASFETKLPPNTRGQDYNVLLPLLEQINLPKGEFVTTEQHLADRASLIARLNDRYGREFIFVSDDDFDPKHHFQYAADSENFRVSTQNLLHVVHSRLSTRGIFVAHRNVDNVHDIFGSCHPYAFFRMEPSKAITIRYRPGLTLAFRGRLADVRSEVDVKQRDGYIIRSTTQTGYGLEKSTTELGYGLVPERRDTFYTILLDDMRVYLFDRKSGQIIAETGCED